MKHALTSSSLFIILHSHFVRFPLILTCKIAWLMEAGKNNKRLEYWGLRQQQKKEQIH